MSESARDTSTELFSTVKYDAQGLVTCVVQDYKDGTVLMVAYMNEESIRQTLKTQQAVFWSRSRQKFWIKGERSGNIQRLKELRVDCDGDCLVAKVEQVGDAACHTGRRSCFYRVSDAQGKLEILGKPLFDPKKVYGA
jgi:phosphoribosyl-AMP cyclohydrolase